MKGIILALTLAVSTAFGMGPAAGADLDDYIRSAGSDASAFCLATSLDRVQWSVLLFLNQKYGAEITIGLIHPSPEFNLLVRHSFDRQFHFAEIGVPTEQDDSLVIDTLPVSLFGGEYPDIAFADPADAGDSIRLTSLLLGMKERSDGDSTAIGALRRIFFQRDNPEGAAVILNDAEIFEEHKARAEEIYRSLGFIGPLPYKPERFRRYVNIASGQPSAAVGGGFLSDLDMFRLPEIIASRTPEGPERRNLLERVNRFRSHLRASSNPRSERAGRLRLIMSAYAEIKRLVDMVEGGSGGFKTGRFLSWADRIQERTLLALKEAIGIRWKGTLEARTTPFGRRGKLFLDLEVAGPLPVELTMFKFQPQGRDPVVIDTISTIVMPHQKLHRQYPVPLPDFDIDNLRADSTLFALGAVVEGFNVDLAVPYAELSDEKIGLAWIPGYAILSPFEEGEITSLAQLFDWQLRVSKPYGRELSARLEVDDPDDIVVGSFEKNIVIPEGVTTRYLDIHLAAGRSLGYAQRRIGARLMAGSQVLAETAADARVVRCAIPETRDIAFVPDSAGQLEDFLRMIHASFQPVLPHGLIRSSLESYDLLVIGTHSPEYNDVLRGVSDRLRRFVADGGDILILGQPFGWPHDIFDFPIYSSELTSPPEARLVDPSHPLLTDPYTIETGALLKQAGDGSRSWSAIMNAGTEIIAAGEQGSYLRVTKIGNGHIIYCGLPLLDLAAKLDVEAIHLLANLLNFGHGER